tara:strand:- start:1824 stop:2792 length:969 start_codon:yes stop_codon:yes gene_type:complete
MAGFDLNELSLGGVSGKLKTPKAPEVITPDFASLPEPEYGSASINAINKPKPNTALQPDLNDLGDLRASSTTPNSPTAPKKLTIDDLYTNWATSKSKADLSAIVNAMKPQISKSISAIVGESTPAIQAKAKLLVIKAVKTFDPKAGSKFTSWVYTQLAPLRRYNQQSKPVPVSERIRRRSAELNYFEEQFEENHGRPPSDSEVSDALGWSKKALQQLRKAKKARVSPDTQIGTGPDDGMSTYGDITPLQEDKTVEVIELFYESLNPVEQSIIEYRLGLWGNPKLTNSETAKKLKLSPARVSQIANKLADDLEQFKLEYGEFI